MLLRAEAGQPAQLGVTVILHRLVPVEMILREVRPCRGLVINADHAVEIHSVRRDFHGAKIALLVDHFREDGGQIGRRGVRSQQGAELVAGVLIEILVVPEGVVGVEGD